MRTSYADGSEDAKEEEAPDLSNDPNYKGWVKVYEASPEPPNTPCLLYTSDAADE